MKHHPLRYGFACILGLSASAAAQGNLPIQRELVVVPGQAFHPIAGAFVAGVNRSCIDNDGAIGWVGELQVGGPAGVTLDDNAILCLSRNLDDTILLAREGAAEPLGAPGYSLVDLGNYVVMGPRSEVAWMGTSQEVINMTQMDGLYVSSPTGTYAICRTGDPLPPPASGSILQLGGMETFGWSASGRVMVQVSTAQLSRACLTGTPGMLETVLYPGQVLTSIPGQPELATLREFQLIDESGAFPFLASLQEGTGTPPLPPGNHNVIGLYRPGQPLLQIARSGDYAPGFSGLVFSNFDIHSDQFGPNGEFTFSTYLMDPTDPNVLVRALYRCNTRNGAIDRILHTDQVVPGVGTILAFTSRSAVFPNGDIGTGCTFVGSGVTTDNDEAYVAHRGGALVVLWREGEPAPGLPGATLGMSGNVTSHGCDRYGNLVVRWFHDAGTSFQPHSTFVWNQDHGLTPWLTTGEVFAAASGPVSLLYDRAPGDRSTGTGGTSAINIHGDVASRWMMRAVLPNGTVDAAGIVRMHVGSLRPSTAAIPAFGGHQITRIDAGAARAGHLYLMVGSLSGTTPGYQYGGFTIPLVRDAWFDISQQNANSAVYLNSLGTLDANGRGTTGFVLPWSAPFLAGAQFHHAVVAFNPANADVTWVSEPIAVRVY